MKNFEEIGKELGCLVDKKDKAYGEAVKTVSNCLEILFPDGIPVEKYQDVYLIIQVLNKLTRISKGDKMSFGEDPWKDAAGYSLHGIKNGQKQQED